MNESKNESQFTKATAQKDLWSFSKIQQKVFSEYREYKVVRINSDSIVVMNNFNEEHVITNKGWMKDFKLS